MLGPSGSGKSTLALALAGLLPRELPGRLIGELRVGASVGLVFQDPASQIVMERAEDDVAFGLENLGWDRGAMRARVPEALEEVGLGALSRQRTATLSGGQQQRLALAGALAPRPGLLVLDEPTANLDPDGARAFVRRLASLRAARAATIVLVEHRVELVWSLADRVLVLGPDGRPIALDSPKAVLELAGREIAEAGVWLPPELERRLGVVPVPPLPAGVPGEELAIAEGLTFAYASGPAVVRGVDLTLRAGDRLALVGPNGSGKSTLGRLLVGLLRPATGRVALLGEPPHRVPPAILARRAGYLFQDPQQQFLSGTVVDEVSLGLNADERLRVPELMAALGLPLERFADRSPYQLSGGEQRRLSLACTLIRQPRLLVLDEPTYGQDRRTYAGLLGILRERLGLGGALLAVTHDERLVADLGHRALRMADGQLVAMRGAMP